MAAFRDQSILVVDPRLVVSGEEVLIDGDVLHRAKTRTIFALNLAYLLEKTNEQVLPAGMPHFPASLAACGHT